MRCIIVSFLLLAFALSGCESVNVNYIGESFAPTQKVDIYFIKTDISKDYTVIGKMIASTSDLAEDNLLRDRIVEEAKKHGADAILIEGMDKQISGEYVDWGGVGYAGSRRYPYAAGGGIRDYRKDVEVTAQLLKYKE